MMTKPKQKAVKSIESRCVCVGGGGGNRTIQKALLYRAGVKVTNTAGKQSNRRKWLQRVSED